MSDTAKSLVLLRKSARPCAEPVAVKTTCRPCDEASVTHWLTALYAQLDPVPVISAGLPAAPAVPRGSRLQTIAASTPTAVMEPLRNRPLWRRCRQPDTHLRMMCLALPFAFMRH